MFGLIFYSCNTTLYTILWQKKYWKTKNAGDGVLRHPHLRCRFNTYSVRISQMRIKLKCGCLKTRPRGVFWMIVYSLGSKLIAKWTKAQNWNYRYYNALKNLPQIPKIRGRIRNVFVRFGSGVRPLSCSTNVRIRQAGCKINKVLMGPAQREEKRTETVTPFAERSNKDTVYTVQYVWNVVKISNRFYQCV